MAGVAESSYIGRSFGKVGTGECAFVGSERNDGDDDNDSGRGLLLTGLSEVFVEAFEAVEVADGAV